VSVAWFHCFAGIAGDMALGSLVDAGADADEVTALVRRLPLEGWELATERVLRGGIACTRAVVTADGDRASSRRHRDIVGLVQEAALPRRVEQRALGVFALLAETEARLHGQDPGTVHLHEVGGHDSVVDVVGTAAALEVLDVEQVAVSAVAVGTGTVATAHGLLPNPAPATVRLLEGVPTVGRDLPVELTTPTGAALVRALASSFGPMPAMTVTSSGYGAGTAEIADLPNCTQVVVGDPAPRRTGPGQPVTLLETNLDDVTGEQVARAAAALLDGGAHDAWVSQVVMKKGRPGQVLHALCDPALADRLRAVMRETTGSFGVRAFTGERWPEARTMDVVQVTGESLRVKAGRDRVKAEPDDVARVATSTGLGAAEVASRAEEAWRTR
jgi:pyridinium-3,5-bisthiocarboxylic acid mononucleotide nickel chelatase